MITKTKTTLLVHTAMAALLSLSKEWAQTNDEFYPKRVLLRRLEEMVKFGLELTDAEMDSLSILRISMPALEAKIEELAVKFPTMMAYAYAGEAVLQFMDRSASLTDEQAELCKLVHNCLANNTTYDALTEKEKRLIIIYANSYSGDAEKRINAMLKVSADGLERV